MKRKYKILFSFVCCFVLIGSFTICSFAISDDMVKSSIISLDSSSNPLETVSSVYGYQMNELVIGDSYYNLRDVITISGDVDNPLILSGFIGDVSVNYAVLCVDPVGGAGTYNLESYNDLSYVLYFSDGTSKVVRKNITYNYDLIDEYPYYGYFNIGFSASDVLSDVVKIDIILDFDTDDFGDFKYGYEDEWPTDLTLYFGFVDSVTGEYISINNTSDSGSILNVLHNIGVFFKESISWTATVLNFVVSNPILLIMVASMIIIGFSVGLLSRIKDS